jgi:hypothetical protein
MFVSRPGAAAFSRADLQKPEIGLLEIEYQSPTQE